jgi:hypothetical protein
MSQSTPATGTTTTTSPSRSGQDPNIQILTIQDFSPGIYRYSLGNASNSLPLTYAPNAPLGSAAQAYRCMNKPGIGLIPFPAYSTYATFTVPVPSGSTSWSPPLINVGMGSVGEQFTDNNSAYLNISDSQTLQVQDLVMAAFSGYGNAAAQGNNTNTFLRVIPNSTGTGFLPQEIVGPVTTVYLENYPYVNRYMSVSFSLTLMNISINYLQYYLIASYNYFASAPFSGVLITPNATTVGSLIAELNGSAYGVYGHEGRVLIFTISYAPVYTTNSLPTGGIAPNAYNSGFNEQIYYTDPPQSPNVPDYDPNFFPAEVASGYGAWGSISTGELFLVRRAYGGMVINGDFAAPSSATKLPAVVGTGNVIQRGTMAANGMIYVTEYDGVYVWNGGNTSSKISTQIPDDATLRPEMTNAIGVQVHHDIQNNMVFFANNWVYDVISNSWWQSENPSVINFATFTRSQSNSRFMWAMPGIGTGTNNNVFPLYGFDWTSRASSWFWLSNPLPVSVGNLVTIAWVEIVVSNPTSAPCTFTVTPQSPSGQTPIAYGNQPQSVTFTIPATASGYRVSGRFGYTDYNVQLSVTAANTNTALSGPVLHQINVGYMFAAVTGAV